jgi:hypothetical protein
LHDADWISCSTSIWQDNYDAAIRREPVPVIGPGKAKGSTSLKNRCDTCGINGLSPCIYSRNMNATIGNVANTNQKTRNMNAVLGRV